MSVVIGGVEIGSGLPCRIVSELSNSHNGSLDLAKRLVRECADAGADFVKLQCFTVDELIALRGDGSPPPPWNHMTMRELYSRAQTPHAWFPALVAECERVGVPWFSSVFGLESLKLLDGLGCPAYKIAALDVGSMFALALGLKPVNPARPPRPIIASSRGERIPWADLTLWCKEGYPQDWSSAAPPSEPLDGISYHGTDVRYPMAAAEAGLSMVEVHVQLDDIPSELEANVSLTVSQLRQLCGAARAARV